MADDNKILKQIADVLALAEGTPYGPERDLAMARYEKLVTRHSIDLQTVREFRDGKQEVQEPVSESVEVGVPKERAGGAYMDLFRAIAEQNGLKVVTNSNNKDLDLYGFPFDIKVTKDLYAVIVGQMVQDANAHLDSGEHAIGKREARKSFYIGFIEQISHRLREARLQGEREAQEDYGKDVSVALVLRDKQSAVQDAYLKGIQGYRLKSRPRKYARDRSAKVAGDNSARKARVFKSDEIGSRGRIAG